MLYYPDPVNRQYDYNRDIRCAFSMIWFIQQLYYLYGIRKSAMDVINMIDSMTLENEVNPLLWKMVFKGELKAYLSNWQ